MNKIEWLGSKFQKLKSLYPSLHQIHGPYISGDKRRRVVLKLKSGKRITKQYAKIKLEIRDGVVYGRDETIDHKDRNTLNDKYSNLIIRERAKHAQLDVKRRKTTICPCAWCGKHFKLSQTQRAGGKMKKKAGPFCSPTCKGKYGASIQNGGKLIKRNPKASKKYYYYLNK